MSSPNIPLRHAWRSLVPELGLVAVVILAYGSTLTYGYAWDDHQLVNLDLAAAFECSFQGIHVRPVWYLSYVLSGQLIASATFEHCLNLAMFALAVVLAHRLALEYLGRQSAAWIVTLVWALLPWNAYPVTWIAQRNDLLIFIFGFSAVLGLRRKKYILAWLSLALAMFSKVTVAFVPLYFSWCAHRHGHRRAAMAFGALFVVYLALALRAYTLYLEPTTHLEQLSWSLRLLRFPIHWFEHLALLTLPIPFFLGLLHALLYLAGLLGLLRGSEAAHPRGTNCGDVWGLAILASLTAAVTPELRICGFESLFWLLAIAQHRRWRSTLPAAVALVALLVAYGASIAATQQVFDQNSFDQQVFDQKSGQPTTEQQPSLYPNDYYRWRRAKLIGLVER